MSPDPSAIQQRHASRAPLVLGVVAVLALAALAGLIAWAVATSRRPTPPAAPAAGFERFEPGWSSAMAKAQVEATFPAGPVELSEVVPTGRRPFDATFTAQEITALLNVYAFDTDVSGAEVSFSDVTASFPAQGVGALSGSLAAQGSTYDAAIQGPVVFTAKGIDSPGATSLTVEGFDVGGERRRQASDAVIAYLNLYLQAAPGLTVHSAEIVEGGVHVTGAAPVRLEHPAIAAE